ncbi:hypothetical protein [Azospirillum sp. TSO5]|uniref:hypothetical protein n=1 Tax=Azospirillum sp. TSO5 TaxID=716760 RepID=UPI000D614706|nr:hypothetical protein [Azospirillum sp. TSO5]PWC98039.1 hypothetical protein TSO5_03270 [Azospirillum sp. TSO5]
MTVQRAAIAATLLVIVVLWLLLPAAAALSAEDDGPRDAIQVPPSTVVVPTTRTSCREIPEQRCPQETGHVR